MTAALGLYANLRLPSPWSPATKKTALVVYGISGAKGVFAVKFAARSDIRPIIAIAGKSKDSVANLIDPSKGGIILDYRDGNEKLKHSIKEALKSAKPNKIAYTLDTIAEHGSPELLSEVLPFSAHLTLSLPNLDCSYTRKDLVTSVISVGYVHYNEPDDNDSVNYATILSGNDFGYVWSRLLVVNA
jgi:NADPH2:quinone reductase